MEQLPQFEEESDRGRTRRHNPDAKAIAQENVGFHGEELPMGPVCVQ